MLIPRKNMIPSTWAWNHHNYATTTHQFCPEWNGCSAGIIKIKPINGTGQKETGGSAVGAHTHVVGSGGIKNDFEELCKALMYCCTALFQTIRNFCTLMFNPNDPYILVQRGILYESPVVSFVWRYFIPGTKYTTVYPDRHIIPPVERMSLLSQV